MTASAQTALDALRARTLEVAQRLESVEVALDGFAGAGRGALKHRAGLLRLRAALAERISRDDLGLPAQLDAPTAEVRFALFSRAVEQVLLGAADTHGTLEAVPGELRQSFESVVTQVLEAEPGFKPALRAKASLEWARRDYAAAASTLERLSALPGPAEAKADALSRLADLWSRRLGRAREALGLYGEALRLSPDDAVLLDRRLKLALELEDWAEATADCVRLLGVVESTRGHGELFVAYLLTLGEIHFYGLDRPAQALGFYLDAVHRLPGHPMTYTLLRDLLEARPDALEGVDVHPDAGYAGQEARSTLLPLLRGAVGRHPADPISATRAFRDAVGFSI